MEVFNFKRGASYHLTNTKERNYVWRQGPWTGTQGLCSLLNFVHFFPLYSVLNFPYLIYLGFKFFRVEALPCTMKPRGPDFHVECVGTLRIGKKKNLTSLSQCRKQTSHRACDADSLLKALCSSSQPFTTI